MPSHAADIPITMQVHYVGMPVTRRPLSATLATAAVASAGAGMVHASAAGSHGDQPTLAWLFALAAVAQIGWGVAVAYRPHRALVVAGIALNASCVAAWALTRTIDLGGPFGTVEEVGFQDLLAAVFATVAVFGGTTALFGHDRAVRRLDAPAIGVASLIVLALTVPAMAATHSHGTDHSHAHVADTETHQHATNEAAGRTHAHTDATAGGPIVSLDDPRLTSAQRARAKRLLDSTRTAMSSFPDESAVVAAGYQWIGDGRRPGGFQHFVNRDYVRDGIELDPNRIESIVLHVNVDGSKTVASAMYILNPGTTLEEAPDIAGSLTPWHDHQNLCWDESGTRLAGIFVDGQCRPGGVRRGTAPMMHVWVDNPPCGPFSGIEGHGGSCEHAHPS
jgi:hypothetical protein